jgi:hypothetical protein
MLGVIAFVVAVIGAILAWVDTTISVPHLLTFVFVVLALMALQGLWTWAPWDNRNPRP